MKKLLWIGAALMLLSGIGQVLAQGPGGGQMDPAMRQRIEAFRKFRDAHKYTFQLTGTVQALAEMDKGTKCPLTADEAKKALAVIAPLKKKPKLTQDEAKNALKGIKAALGTNTKQLNELSRILQEAEKKRAARRGGGGGAPGGAGARPGGAAPGGGGAAGGRSGGSRTPFDPAKMKDFNPFLPPKPGDERAARMAKPLQEAIAQLEKKSKQKK